MCLCGNCAVCMGYSGPGCEPVEHVETHARFGERVRQAGLTRTLGQVTCAAPEGHDYYVALEKPCDHCGAAL